MTTLAQDSALRGPPNGGVAARRAVVRWGWRMFRREWRQQILVVALLTVAVAAAIVSIILVYNTSPEFDGEFGSASGLLMFDGSDPQALAAALGIGGGVVRDDGSHRPPQGSRARRRRDGGLPRRRTRMAPTAAISSRSVVAATRPGSARSPSPRVWPTLLDVELGATLDLDGRRRTVVGIVENPLDLSDEFALVSPSSAGAPQNVTVLVNASQQETPRPSQTPCPKAAFGPHGNGEPRQIEAADSLAMFSVATVFLLLASLVAAAGFAVVAQRRLRQLGMLAAIGATQKHLRLVLLTNGAVVGVIAAILGTIAGGALWVIFAPTLESAMGHRIDRLSLPWTLLAIVVLFAILGGYRGRLVARANGRPPPHTACAFGASASAEARTPLGDRRRGADHGRHRLSRTLRPRPSAAHHRRDRRNDPRHPAPGPTRDPRPLRSRRTRPDRHAPGPA